MGKNAKSVKDGWNCISRGRFEELKEFCGGLATISSVSWLRILKKVWNCFTKNS
jgi:hypothetical protein